MSDILSYLKQYLQERGWDMPWLAPETLKGEPVFSAKRHSKKQEDQLGILLHLEKPPKGAWGYFISNYFENSPVAFPCLNLIADWEDEECKALAMEVLLTWLDLGGKPEFPLVISAKLETVKARYANAQ